MTNKRKPKWDMLTDEARREVIQRIIGFFKSERDEQIGLIAAGQFYDFFMESVAVDIYNKGIKDAKNIIKERFEGLNIDLDLLLNK